MKSLEKDRNRRYETANAFAADVQRSFQKKSHRRFCFSYGVRRYSRRFCFWSFVSPLECGDVTPLLFLVFLGTSRLETKAALHRRTPKEKQSKGVTKAAVKRRTPKEKHDPASAAGLAFRWDSEYNRAVFYLNFAREWRERCPLQC